ncbi:ferric reductase-like transmembrane component [Trichoderma citrinoviride]|uniref:Ferric reductase-like transmembrane component n=1 Tax=Trichoderma citrinoviride TaxID=58853 RepID=A0A2T4B6K6_9HYPO|nr:ferric reductase-like transmembrane component [Trichoderma citrinoviride]PTB64869.1 ferric reductase-like transmembrane component [Trichoderma citrinoviride]
MRSALAACVLSSWAHGASALLEGFGRTSYDPLCAESCLRSFTSLMLPCTEMEGDSMGMMVTSPSCRAENTPFLTSVAWCMSDKCVNVPASKLEAYWEDWVTGDKAIQPKWTFSEALFKVDPRPPVLELKSSDTTLNASSIVAPTTYLSQWNVLGEVRDETAIESKYSVALVVVSVGLPVLTTWLGYLPWIPDAFDKLKPYVVYPSTIGTYSVRPLPFLLGNAPTTGQGIYITLFIVLNVVFTAVEYHIRQPNAWFANAWHELIAFLLYRTGSFAFALLPVLILFASRNNVLLWLANWSHSTYLLLHRWVGRMFALYAVLHSIFGLLTYKQYENTVWWKWGAAATVCSVALWLGSGLYVRRANYEIFLVSHIVLSVVVVVGCWYHLVLWYESMGMHLPGYTSGYEDWLYTAIAVWFADRLVRVVRVLRSGIRRSVVTDLGAGYVRVDIPGIRWGVEPGKHVYAYFPTLSPLRPWENHPFSIVPTAIFGQSNRSSNSKELSGSPSPSAHRDEESLKQAAGVTLLIKKSAGITKHLERHSGLLTLLEGPYASGDPKDLLRCDRLVLIGGGIGITSLLPWAYNHWNVRVVWSVKDSAACLVDEVKGALDTSSITQKDIRIGSRFSVAEVIEEEASLGWHKVGVIVSGPGSLCDDVRAAVSLTGRAGHTKFHLEVDAYSW